MKLNFFLILCFVFLHRVKSFSLHDSCDIQNPSAAKGKVVYYKDCPKVVQVCKKTVRNSDESAFLNSRDCGKFKDEYLVCCEVEPTTTSAPTITTAPTTTTAPTKTTATNASAAPTIPYSTYFPAAPICGSYLGDRIVGGENTKIDEFPWAALMQYTYPDGKKEFRCGGVLISDQYVLTASHCLNGRGIAEKEYKLTGVRLGEWKLSTETDCDDDFMPPYCSDPYRDFVVEEAFPYENYEPKNKGHHNDIALLRLTEKIEKFTTFIKPICLPLEESVRNFDLTNAMMFVTGWGITETNRTSDIKQKVGIKGVDRAKCQTTYLNTTSQIFSSQVCAGGETGRDSCNGDSGGPLMRETIKSNIPHWFLVGVVSYGPTPCGKLNWPGVYTRVDHYIDWIVSKMKP